MNSSFELLPATCDVLVIGAGPSGSAAALTLARAGMDVVLIDQHAFPREKICGDALIPDAHRALARLGVLDEVMRQAQAVGFMRCSSPRGGHVDVAGTLAVLPRRQLDDIVCKAAVAAGARMFAPVRFSALIEEGGQVVGARLAQPGPAPGLREVRAPWVILATGAAPQALMAAGMAERRTPSAISMRCYIRHEAMAGRIDKLEFLLHPALAPGYGWIFPCGNGVFNVGVILNMPAEAARGKPSRKPRAANLHQMFEVLGTLSESARELMAGGTRLGPLKGAPLRCTLQGARLSRPGLLVTGEAAGSTYAFSGEGIGKALETGILSAESILQGAGQDEAGVRSVYASRIDGLRPNFAHYERANLVYRYPFLADILIRQAQRSARLRQRLSGVINETSNPGQLFTLKGMVKLFTE